MAAPPVFVTTATAAEAIGFDAEESSVREVFGRLGPITAAASRYDAELRRFGFEITFGTAVAAEAALHLDGVRLRARVLAVSCGDPRLESAVRAELRARREAGGDGPARPAALTRPAGPGGEGNRTPLLPRNHALPDGLQLDALLAAPLRDLAGGGDLFDRLLRLQLEAAAAAAALADLRPRADAARAKRRRERPDEVADAARRAAVGSRLARTVAVQGVPVDEDMVAHVAARLLDVAPVARYGLALAPGSVTLLAEFAAAAGAAAVLRLRAPGATAAALVVEGVPEPLPLCAAEPSVAALPPPQLPPTWSLQQQRSIATHVTSLFAV